MSDLKALFPHIRALPPQKRARGYSHIAEDRSMLFLHMLEPHQPVAYVTVRDQKTTGT